MSQITSTTMMKFIVLLALMVNIASAGLGDGGSRCPDATCTPAPSGVKCDAKYEREDGCCPVWYCTNGQTVYGIQRSSSYSTSSGSGSQSSWSSSSSTHTSSGSGSTGNGPDVIDKFANVLENLFNGR